MLPPAQHWTCVFYMKLGMKIFAHSFCCKAKTSRPYVSKNCLYRHSKLAILEALKNSHIIAFKTNWQNIALCKFFLNNKSVIIFITILSSINFNIFTIYIPRHLSNFIIRQTRSDWREIVHCVEISITIKDTSKMGNCIGSRYRKALRRVR